MLVAFIRRQRTLEAVRRVVAAMPSPITQPSSPVRRGETTVPAPETGYAAAFARVRLVRAWISAAAAVVALAYAFASLLDRVLP
jgi:hypothetical protein